MPDLIGPSGLNYGEIVEVTWVDSADPELDAWHVYTRKSVIDEKDIS